MMYLWSGPFSGAFLKKSIKSSPADKITFNYDYLKIQSSKPLIVPMLVDNRNLFNHLSSWYFICGFYSNHSTPSLSNILCVSLQIISQSHNDPQVTPSSGGRYYSEPWMHPVELLPVSVKVQFTVSILCFVAHCCPVALILLHCPLENLLNYWC